MTSASARPASGGVAARRAVVRWGWRLLRREWRQQALVLALLTVAVAAAVGGASAAYNIAPVPSTATFGTAHHLIGLDVTGASALDADLAAAREWFGTIDVIGRVEVPVPGSFRPVELRLQDPHGAYGAPMLALRSGRYPTSDGEIAVTDGVAAALETAEGGVLVLDGRSRTVVGTVENPSALEDEFALAAPTSGDLPDAVRVLVNASDDRVMSFRAPSGGVREIGSRPRHEGALAAAGVFGVATVVLLLVALLATAGFTVIAQRRVQQLGMLGAIGATERHVRLVVLANGAGVGVLAALAGATLGLGGWIAVVPLVETAAGYRIDRFGVPWWLIVTGMVLAVVAATVAAWWPARSVARVPTVLALSGRPPRSAPPPRRSAALAALLVVGGLVMLVTVDEVADDTAVYWADAMALVGGTLATLLGVLLISPLAIRALAGCASGLPIAVRLALRDLGRHQARSGAALAAVTLVLGIPAALVIGLAAAEHGPDTGNLSDRQLMVRAAELGGPFVPEAADLAGLEAGVDRIAASLEDPVVTAIDVAIDPALPPDTSFEGRMAITLATPSGDGWRDVSLLYVATPDLLRTAGVDADAVHAPSGILTSEQGVLRVLGVVLPPGTDRSDPEIVTDPEPIAAGYSSLPASFVTPDSLRQRGWERAPSGRWLIETPEPVTADQLTALRAQAAADGLTIEARDDQAGLATLRTGATAGGMLLALGVLAMTVGLIRGEAAGDLRTLTAAGATRPIRRGLTAATAGALALLGSMLGVAGACLVLGAGYLDGIGELAAAPVAPLVLLVAGVPALAAGAGWIVAGREPAALARQPAE